jgi:hypothetical protein
MLPACATVSRFQLLSRAAWVSILLLFSGVDDSAQIGADDPKPINAIQGIVAAFKQHPVVIIGEAHWLRQSGDFYVRLIRDHEFQETVQDIVIEFASRNNQPLLDRYIGGENVTIEEVRHIWRDTTKVASWESPIYAEWLAAIREVNEKLPPARRLRVLAGDTPVDWTKIHTHSDWVALGNNDISISDVIENEVLKRRHHALVVLGSNHVTKFGGREGSNVTTRVETQYPGSTHVLLLLNAGPLRPALEDKLKLPSPSDPTVYELAGTSIANLTDENWPPLIRVTDALLYLAPRGAFTMAFPAPGSLEQEYLKEIDRRSLIEWGELRARKFLGAAAQ